MWTDDNCAFVENSEENREIFTNLRKLSVDINAKNIDNGNVSILSMGMTNDYAVAIEEGATMVRVGTGILVQEIIIYKNIKKVMYKNMLCISHKKECKHGSV